MLSTETTTPILKLSWQHISGDWHQFPDDQITMILHQQADRALLMLASFLPVVMEHDGGYLCTKGLYPTIKKKHQKCITFDTALKRFKGSDIPLYKALDIPINTLTIKA